MDVEPSSLLDRFLPPGAIQLIFASEDHELNKTHVVKAAAERRIPTLSIYVISTNRENEACIEMLFREVPCRIYRMKAADFFTEQEGGYEGIGIDRLSNLKAAEHFYKPPLVVFDGGTCMTYTATNARGKIVGGGIYPGIHALHRCMHDYTGALPLIPYEKTKKLMDDAMETKTPMPLFSTNTQGAMVVTTLKAVAEVCWGAVDNFKTMILADKESAENGENGDKTNSNDDGSKEKEKDVVMVDTDGEKIDDDEDRLFTVVVTGGDGNLISQLLEPDYSSLIPGPPRPAEALDGVHIQKHKHLCHYGVQYVLKTKMAEVPPETNLSKIRDEIRGQRIAKKFKIRNEERIFRGSVAAVAPGKIGMELDWYFVRYDDGDTEHLGITDLYGAFVGKLSSCLFSSCSYWLNFRSICFRVCLDCLALLVGHDVINRCVAVVPRSG